MDNIGSHFFGKNAMVTGATGFIGSHICQSLVSHGAKVTALVRSESDTWRLEGIADQVDIITVDLLDLENLTKVMEVSRPNFIFHFAIPAHAVLRNEVDLEHQIDITGKHLTNLFEAAHRDEVLEAFVHACSGSIYEWSAAHHVLSEKSPIKPATLRGKLKLQQRNTCLKLAESYGVPVRLARVFRAYGPMEVSTKLIVKALECHRKNEPLAIGSDAFKRDYIYVKDLVDGILLLSMQKGLEPIELNFGGQQQYSAAEIVAHLEKLLSSEIPKKLNAYPKNLYDLGNIQADCHKAYKMLGWQSSTSLEDGLVQTIEWYQRTQNE